MAMVLTEPLVRSGAAPRLRQWLAVAACTLMFYMVVIGTKPLQARVADAASAGGDSVRQLAYLAVFGLLLFGAQPHRNPRRLAVLPLSLLPFLGWCLLSTGWALFPDVALRRFLLTAMLVWSIFRITDELGCARTIALLRWLMVAALVANLLAVAGSPLAVHQFGERGEGDPNLAGSWRGVLGHKNWAGALTAATILFFVFGGRHWPPAGRAAVLAAAAAFLWKTQSKTSINMLVVALVAGWLFRRYNPAYRALLVPLVMVAGSAVSTLLVMHWSDILAPVYGSDRTAFTGRVMIWSMMIDFIRDHFWLGAGFGSFWNTGPDGPVFQYGRGWITELASGHNGYLDLMATLGLPGLILGVTAAMLVPLGRLLASLSIGRDLGALLCAMLVFAFGHNMTESTLMERDAILQMFLMLAVAMIAVGTRRRPVRGAARAGPPGGTPMSPRPLDSGTGPA